MLCVTVFLATTVLFLFYYHCVKPLSYWKEKGIKQTDPVWIFGDMLKTTFRTQRFHEWLVERYQKFPDDRYFGFYQFTRPMLMIKDAELIKQICVKDFEYFEDHRTMISEKVDPLWGNNLFALKGQKWRDMRPILSPAFTSSKMKSMFGLMSKSAETFLDFFLEKPDDLIHIECKDIFTRYCNDVIASTAFGIEVDSLRDPNNEFYRLGWQATNFNNIWQSIKLMFFVCAPKVADILKIRFFGEHIGNFFFALVDQNIKEREEKNIVRPDVLHLLLQARKGKLKQDTEINVVEAGFSVVQEMSQGKVGPVKLTNTQIASQAMVFFFGGFDSVSTLMCFLVYVLSIHTDVQDKLRHEIDETFEECGGNLTYEALMKMKYMDMVMSETLRRWPNAQFLDRECTKPYTIQPVKPGESPVHLRKGDNIWIPVFAIQLDEKFYPDPERFDPERFNDENKRDINLNTFLPFGVGPRNCIGSRFALLESKVLMFHLLRHFEIVPTEKSPIPLILSYNPFQITPKGGFQFGFKRLRSVN